MAFITAQIVDNNNIEASIGDPSSDPQVSYRIVCIKAGDIPPGQVVDGTYAYFTNLELMTTYNVGGFEISEGSLIFIGDVELTTELIPPTIVNLSIQQMEEGKKWIGLVCQVDNTIDETKYQINGAKADGSAYQELVSWTLLPGKVFYREIDLTPIWQSFGDYNIEIIVSNGDIYKTSEVRTIKMKRARPENFYFSSEIQSGAEAKTLKASDWNTFCNRVNQFREYKELSTRDFTWVESGQRMLATILAEPYDAIDDLYTYGLKQNWNTTLARPQENEIIYASYFHGLAGAINSIE